MSALTPEHKEKIRKTLKAKWTPEMRQQLKECTARGEEFWTDDRRFHFESVPHLCCLCQQWHTEYYMVRPDVWTKAGFHPNTYVTVALGMSFPDEMCCIPCLSHRIGRQLTVDDFLPSRVTERFLQFHPRRHLIAVAVVPRAPRNVVRRKKR